MSSDYRLTRFTECMQRIGRALGDKKFNFEEFDLILEAGRSERNYWGDLWRYRELFYFLAWRDILVRYKQAVIGIAWALVRPFLTMIIFTVVFEKVAKMPSPSNVPYPLLVFAGMLPWQFFSSASSEASNSLIGNANLISKVYFPRLIVPMSSIITSFVDFLLTLTLMLLMMVWYRFFIDWHVIVLPFFIILAFGGAFGLGIWLCALNVRYRDFRFIVPFIVQFGLYVSPVGFSSNVVPDQWRWLYELNPIVGVIEGFRWSLLCGAFDVSPRALLSSLLVTLILCASGVWYFRRMEKTFADVI